MSDTPEQLSRTEWDKFSGEIQQNVNETLGMLKPEIESSTLILEDLLNNDFDNAAQYGDDLIEYLDAQWGYVGDVFFVVGEWYEPKFAQDDHGIFTKLEPHEAYMRATSDGFAIEIDEDEDTGHKTPHIRLSFKVLVTNLNGPYIRGPVELFAQADMDKVSLQYIRPETDDVVNGSPYEVEEAIMTANSLLYLYMHHEGSEFFRASARKQNALLMSVIESAASALPAPDTKDAAVIEGINTPYFYFYDKAAGVIRVAYSEKEGTYVFNGSLVGVTVSDIFANGQDKKYTRPSELAAAAEGLSLIIQPTSVANFDPAPLQDSPVFIPFQMATDMTLSIE